MDKGDKISHDRTEGVRRRARVSPSDVFTDRFKYPKDPPEVLDVDALCARLCSLGFRDGNTRQSRFIIQHIGYQHSSSYMSMAFKACTHGIEPSMKTLNRLMLFDRKLQALLMEYIGLFELEFRAQYSHHMALHRGPFAHRNPKNFLNKGHYDKFLADYGVEFGRQLNKRNAAIEECYERYGDAPIWLAVEVMSFGTLSKLFRNTKSKDVRKGVAGFFHCTVDELASWTKAISVVRNTCAHFGKLVGTRLVSRPKKVYGVDYDNSQPFYILLLLLKMLCAGIAFEDDADLSYDLMLLRDVVQLLVDYEDIIDAAGIPSNWVQLIGSPNVLGQKLKIDSDFYERNEETGRVWLRVQ